MYLCRYHLAQERKGRALNMYPPGRIIFLRPIKVRKKRKHGGEGKLVKRWDAVWVSPREVVGEGILVSKRVRPLVSLVECSTATFVGVCLLLWGKSCAGTWLLSAFKEELSVSVLPCRAPAVLDTLDNLSGHELGHLLTFA